MLNDTQIKFVKEKLRQTGEISRNECLKNYISRLGAIIYKLKQKGFEFSTDYRQTQNGKDYIYKLKKHPQEY